MHWSKWVYIWYLMPIKGVKSDSVLSTYHTPKLELLLVLKQCKPSICRTLLSLGLTCPSILPTIARPIL